MSTRWLIISVDIVTVEESECNPHKTLPDKQQHEDD